MCSNSDQLLTARSHVDKLKCSSSRLSELENLFRSPQTGETWSVGTALGELTAQLNSALSSFDALEIPDVSLLVKDDLPGSENTEHVDDSCRELRESIMLVIQSLYKMRDHDSENEAEDQHADSDEGNVDCDVAIIDSSLTEVRHYCCICAVCHVTLRSCSQVP